MRRCLVSAVLAVLVVSGCSSEAGDESGARRPPPGLTQAWRTFSISPIGQPVAAGDMVVVYGTATEDLFLYGVAVSDGSIRWRQPASPGAVETGVPLHPTVLDGRVAYFRPEPGGNRRARLVVASPGDGRDLLVSGPEVFRSHPRQCADGRDFCVLVDDARGVSGLRRFALDGRTAVPETAAPPADSRFVGENLVELGSRNPETLAAFVDGTVTWRSPLSRHFPAGYTTDLGWHFELYRSAGVEAGSVGAPSRRDEGATIAYDLAKARTAGIDVATGKSAWQDAGTSFLCDSKVEVEQKVPDSRTESVPVRCRYRGTARYGRGSTLASYEGLDVTLEGFDPATGRTTWSVPLGAAEDFMREGTNATRLGETEVLVQEEHGPVIVDVLTGATRPPQGGDAYWCEKENNFTFRDGATARRWRGGTLLSPCTAGGSPSTVVPRYLPPALGATVGDRTVLAEAAGMVAYDRTG